MSPASLPVPSRGLRAAGLLSLLVVALLAAGCKRANEAFCCLTPEDCAANGVDEPRRACADGLACVDNSCEVATCASAGCGPAAPVCDLEVDQCVGCQTSADCAAFPTTSVCAPETGACVACLTSQDCGAAAPVCEDTVCRTCERGAECPSGACDADGTCVPEDRVVYLSPGGVDALPCSKAAPCKQLSFGVRQTTGTRNHIVLTPNTHPQVGGPLNITGAVTNAAKLYIHGSGATLSGGSSDGFLYAEIPMLFEDVTLASPVAEQTITLIGAAPLELRRVRVTGYFGLGVSVLTATDVVIEAANTGLTSNGTLNLERVTIRGGATGLRMGGGAIFATNLLVHGMSGLGLDVTNTGGRIEFMTLANTGQGVTGTSGLSCTTSTLDVAWSILWPNTTERSRPVVTGTCSVIDSLVGAQGLGNNIAADPLFVSTQQSDFRLSGASPARDVVDAGPAVDVVGTSRPQGPRFDLGAFETP